MKVKYLFSILLLFNVTRAYASPLENVLLISIDTLRADHLSCYGSTNVQTPRIDALARNGVVFKNTVSPTPFTLPSHTSLLTGLIPPVHGIRDNGGFYLSRDIVTLSEIFKSKGYSTGAFLGAFPLDSRFGLDQGFDLYDDSYPIVTKVSELTMPERDAKAVADSALKWLGQKSGGRWFAWVHFYDPHFPYKPPVPWKEKYSADAYAGEVAYTDEQIGRILDFLKGKGLDKKTLVVITADHGESLGEHQEKTHGIFAYESTLRIPLIFAPAAPAVIDSRVRLIDIPPTILAMQNLEFPGKIQGQSLLPLFKQNGRNSYRPGESYFESLSLSLNAQWAPLKGFYSKNFKYISLPVPELYDVSIDPAEKKNLCENEVLCSQWSSRFSAYSKAFNTSAVRQTQMDRETAEQLRALGYVSSSNPATEKTNFDPRDDPKNLISFHNRVDAALGFFNRGYELKALEIFEKIIEDRPDYSVAYLHASFIQSTIGFPDKAVELLKSALQAGLKQPELHAKLGLYLYEAGKYEEALQHLNLIAKMDPKDLDTVNYLGMTYTALGKYPEAQIAFEKALKLDPSDAMTLTNVGTFYLTQKKFDPAIQNFQAAIASNPNISGAYNGLAVAYASQKEWDQAINSWNKAIQANNKNFDAMLNLAYAYLERNQKDKALPLFVDFSQNAPSSRYRNDLLKVRSLIRQLQGT